MGFEILGHEKFARAFISSCRELYPAQEAAQYNIWTLMICKLAKTKHTVSHVTAHQLIALSGASMQLKSLLS